MSRPVVRAWLLLALMLLTSACELTVRIDTTVEDDGSGAFSLAIELDEELVEGLQQAAAASEDAESSIATLDALFTRLDQQGWETSRTAPEGGLLLEARRRFADQADFDRALEELSGAGTSDEQPVDLASLKLGLETERTFLRTKATFDGSIDLGFGADADPMLEQLADVLDDAVTFEISARLPGPTTVREGEGTIEGDTVVWRPRFGEATTFLADSSRLRTSSLLMIVITAFLVIGLIGWLLMGRKPRTDLPDDPEPITREQPAIL